MKKVISLICLASLLLFAGCGNNNSGQGQNDADAEAAAAAADSLTQAAKNQSTMDKIAALPEEPVFDINTSLGTIKVRLYADTPKHRENFARLACTGFHCSA